MTGSSWLAIGLKYWHSRMIFALMSIFIWACYSKSGTELSWIVNTGVNASIVEFTIQISTCSTLNIFLDWLICEYCSAQYSSPNWSACHIETVRYRTASMSCSSSARVRKSLRVSRLRIDSLKVLHSWLQLHWKLVDFH